MSAAGQSTHQTPGRPTTGVYTSSSSLFSGLRIHQTRSTRATTLVVIRRPIPSASLRPQSFHSETWRPTRTSDSGLPQAVPGYQGGSCCPPSPRPPTQDFFYITSSSGLHSGGGGACGGPESANPAVEKSGNRVILLSVLSRPSY